MTLLRKTGDTVKRSTLVPRSLTQGVPKGLTRRAFLALPRLALAILAPRGQNAFMTFVSRVLSGLREFLRAWALGRGSPIFIVQVRLTHACPGWT